MAVRGSVVAPRLKDFSPREASLKILFGRRVQPTGCDGSSYTHRLRVGGECGGHGRKPALIGHSVVIRKSDDVVSSVVDSMVASRRQTRSRFPRVSHAGIA